MATDIVHHHDFATAQFGRRLAIPLQLADGIDELMRRCRLSGHESLNCVERRIKTTRGHLLEMLTLIARRIVIVGIG
jgi:hypothetical protein